MENLSFEFKVKKILRKITNIQSIVQTISKGIFDSRFQSLLENIATIH